MSKSDLIKITIVGVVGVGKTTLSMRLVTGEFIDTKMTVGFDIESRTKMSESGDSQAFKASIFDMGGQEQFQFFQEALIKGTKLVIVVFNVNSYKTYIAIEEWIPLIKEIPKDMWILVGNKMDEGLVFSMEEIINKANELGIKWFLVSAKSGEGVNDLIGMIEDMIT